LREKRRKGKIREKSVKGRGTFYHCRKQGEKNDVQTYYLLGGEGEKKGSGTQKKVHLLEPETRSAVTKNRMTKKGKVPP